MGPPRDGYAEAHENERNETQTDDAEQDERER